MTIASLRMRTMDDIEMRIHSYALVKRRPFELRRVFWTIRWEQSADASRIKENEHRMDDFVATKWLTMKWFQIWHSTHFVKSKWWRTQSSFLTECCLEFFFRFFIKKINLQKTCNFNWTYLVWSIALIFAWIFLSILVYS